MEANTPGQNTLLGMSGHDSGRLVTPSHSGKLHHCTHRYNIYKHTTEGGVDATFLATHSESNNVQIKPNAPNARASFYHRGWKSTWEQIIKSFFFAFLCMSRKKKRKEIKVSLLQKNYQTRVNHV